MLTVLQNVLEMEAAVQRDPTNPDLWCALGVRQQENEREQKAIQALQRALELQPVHGAARLALAVSLTNEGNRGAAVDALYEWAVRLPGWEAVRNKPVNDGGLQRVERASLLVDALLEVARIDTSQEIDADIQIALAVLLNTNEVWSALCLEVFEMVVKLMVTCLHRIGRSQATASARRCKFDQM
jgi:peroxin-5